MFFMCEQPILSEQEAWNLIQESSFDDPGKVMMREKLLDPVIRVMKTPSGTKKYLKVGNDFIDANAEMLAKQYPTKRVVFPRKYVDEVLAIFGFTVPELKKTIKEILKTHVSEADFNTIVSYPSNVIHAMVLIYSDMVTDPAHVKDGRNLIRDSARQQMGLTVYQSAFNKFFPSPHPKESIMEYTYQHLDRSWNLVKDENMINWIGESVETSYAFHRTKLAVDLTPKVFVDFMNRVWNTFRQNLQTIANRYYADLDAGNEMAPDTEDASNITTNELTKIRNNLVRKISGGDDLYHRMNQTYKAIAELKVIKPPEALYEFAQKVDKKDIGNIIDVILYVFIVKEGNTLDDINSSKYIGRITKFPTAIDRAIAGKPIILPMCEKYEVQDKLVKAYICYIATYIMQRINDVRDD